MMASKRGRRRRVWIVMAAIHVLGTTISAFHNTPLWQRRRPSLGLRSSYSNSEKPKKSTIDEEAALNKIVEEKRAETGVTAARLAETFVDNDSHSAESDDDEDDKDFSTMEYDEEQIQQWRKEDTSGVYDALNALERAVTLENPELKLEHAELQDKLRYIEQGKHLLFPTIFKFVVMPSIYAFGLHKVSATNKIARGFVKMMDIHFWTCVVAAPMIVLAAKERVRKEDPLPKELQGFSEEAISLLPTHSWTMRRETPETTCKDYTFVLLQYWTSAVKGMCAVPLVCLFNRYLTVPSSGLTFWTAFTQFLTRVAAMASLYQFPELLYQIQRTTQMRPIGFFPTATKTMVAMMLQVAPFGVISDFSKVLASLSNKFKYPLYTSIFILLYGFWFRAYEAERACKEEPTKPYCELPSMKTNKKLFYALSLMLLWRQPIMSFASRFQPTVLRLFRELMFVNATPFFWVKFFGVGYLLSIPILGPTLHLAAISRIFRISFTRDVPILTEAGPINIEDNDWRYWISWREPKRFHLVKEEFQRNLVYQVFTAGTERDTIDKLKAEDRYEDFKPWFMWSRYAEDKEGDPETFTREPPNTWKARAMKNMRRAHEANFQSNNTSEDPLGIVLHRGFKLGLGLDHFTRAKKLKEGEGGSRAVQALAAEKALNRYNHLMNVAKLEEDAEQAMDPSTRKKLKKERDERIDMELDYIAKQLTEYVPSTLDDKLVDPNEKLNKFLGNRMPEKFVKVNDHEYRIIRDEKMAAPDFSDPLADTRSNRYREFKVSASVKAIMDGRANKQDVDKDTSDGKSESDTGSSKRSDSDEEDDDHDDNDDGEFDNWEPTIVYA